MYSKEFLDSLCKTTAKEATQSAPDDLPFMKSLDTVLKSDFNGLVKARANYGESWCKRGGVGAYMMLARKWDRLENYLGNPPNLDPGAAEPLPLFNAWDIFEAIEEDKRAEGVIDDIRDLRRYLALVEAKMIERGVVHEEVKKDAPTLGMPIGDGQFIVASDPAPTGGYCGPGIGDLADKIQAAHREKQLQPADLRCLFVKYIRYLREVEGADFVLVSEQRNNFGGDFDEREWGMLQVLAEEASRFKTLTEEQPRASDLHPP